MRTKKLLLVLALLMAAALSLLIAPRLARAGDKALWPKAGNVIKQSDRLKLDVSHSEDGYFMAMISRTTSKRLKLRVVTGETTLDYDLPGDGGSIVVPLQMGSGKYKITLYENTTGRKYASAGTITLTVKLKREDGAFLYPNQYVDYNQATLAVAKADELCAGKSEREAYDAVCAYLKTYAYDVIKAINIKPGMLPDIDDCFERRRGVCQDLAAVMCCMLRTQGIPSRLVIGMADKNYHAWTVITLDGQDVFYDPTAALKAISIPRTYTVERFY